MHIHIIGISGTFMAGIASIANAMNISVTGCDENTYPPMSDVLAEQGIGITQGYGVQAFDKQPDMYVIGNAAKRGMPVIEDILTNKRPYISGPEWLYQHVLRHKTVIAVSGTHGKTTTSSLLAWTLECAGLSPSFLIGGAPRNFGISARAMDSELFVIEADEYDTAFFDKRSKMVHYRPDIALVNNLEFDHADLFEDMHAIQKQFHGMLRVIPEQGVIVCPSEIESVDELLAMGTWSKVVRFNHVSGLHATLINADGSQFDVLQGAEILARISWDLIGWHNVQNALAVFAVCISLNIDIHDIERAFKTFKSVKRRLELKKIINNVRIYDDFAHHPTAIQSTVNGLRAKIKEEAFIAIVDFGSHTMRSGLFFKEILKAVESADLALFLNAPTRGATDIPLNVLLCDSIKELEQAIKHFGRTQHVLVMSNKANQYVLEKLNTLF